MAVKKNALIEALYQIVKSNKVSCIDYSNHDNYLRCGFEVMDYPQLLEQLMAVCSLVDCRFKFENKNGVINVEIQLL